MARLIPLSEGSFTVDQTKNFIPFDPEKDHMTQRSKGSLLVEIQPFLLVTDTDKILLDTGLGFKNEAGQLQIHQNLINHGIQPADVTKVIFSHLHKDHASGAITVNEAGQASLNFPNAHYYINRKELEYALEPENTSYKQQEISHLKDHEQVILLGASGSLDHYIHYEESGGHSPHHQVIKIVDQEEIYFFGGDVAPQYFQLTRSFAAKYDYDGKRSRDLRASYLKQGQVEHWTFLFYHDIKTPFKKV